MNILVFAYWLVVGAVCLIASLIMACALLTLFRELIPIKWLYVIRSWIDTRVPRDMLLVQIRDKRGILLHADHHELIHRARMQGGLDTINLRSDEQIQFVFAHQYMER